MKFGSEPYRLALAISALVMLFPLAASAYLDPGSGSYFFQILLGLVLTVSVSLRLFWGRLLGAFRGLFTALFRNDRNKPT